MMLVDKSSEYGDLSPIIATNPSEIRGRDATSPWRMLPSTRGFVVAGAGFEPATFGL